MQEDLTQFRFYISKLFNEQIDDPAISRANQYSYDVQVKNKQSNKLTHNIKNLQAKLRPDSPSCTVKEDVKTPLGDADSLSSSTYHKN